MINIWKNRQNNSKKKSMRLGQNLKNYFIGIRNFFLKKKLTKRYSFGGNIEIFKKISYEYVMSRCFGFIYSNVMIIPFADMFNHKLNYLFYN